MIGQCLCGEVKFEISGNVPNFYHCHCLLCRKQSGTMSNAATFISENNFVWLGGEDKISKYKKETGFSSNFCSSCGSPVPNRLRDTDNIWVPAGLLEDVEDRSVVVELYTDSAVCWNSISTDGDKYGEMPDFDTLKKKLNK